MTPFAKALAVLIALAAGGCASVPRAGPSDPAAPGASSGPSGSAASAADAARIAAAARGERVTLGANTLPGRTSVIVGARYDAASGRVCRRLHDDDGSTLPRIVCGGAGSWRFVRSLEPRAARPAPLPVVVTPVADRTVAARPALAAAAPARTAAPAPVASSLAVFPIAPGRGDLAMRAPAAGETLWGFSRRVTGDGDNWHEIARLNDIEDPTRFEGGRALAVPDALVRN